MRYVLDASVALCWVIPRPLSPRALRLRDDPSIFPAEAASGLTKAERQKLIAIGDARSMLAKILRTLPVLHAYGRLLYRATEISSRTRSGLYDCLYVAMAEREQCELVTADDKLVRNLQAQFPFIVSLASLP